MKESSSQPFLAHLIELRSRLLYMFLALIVGTGLSFLFAEEIYHWLATPLYQHLPKDSHLITLSIMEGWLVYFKTAFIAGVCLSAPFCLYHLWAFLAPGLLKQEQSLLIKAALGSSFCFLIGILFCYYVIMPTGLSVLIAFVNPNDITFMPQMSLYLSFVTRLLFSFGFVFQLPLLIVLLVKWRIVELATFKRLRRHMVVAAFVIGAILTPPDALTQTMMALPFIVLYEVGILLARGIKVKNEN
ncbi:MAG: twin-arginine translocase subunit TatC [Deltaproteobacteria bacterium CG_4_10_14_0_2_um_filter_43_8]|nr:MAG: twin-arginine translocase subunit TatC [Deltaproteobacteria bacterium CG11_big_fil_rev_8_21_14_0_20_42_23]PJA18858.1 MAG: twin-arginine translocase subunit TatC [Deltaproteobacteria bacterium CG_4_10_14_0_2_um_filter_43_8]PJC65069.1 MAG: twin-arginine translocase subunit TatC [Deltaproteobacteria bacterium CG_4_9_14_0_2_um_filter_42_21]